MTGGDAAGQHDAPPLPEQLIDSLQDAAGNHPGFRLNHARGVLLVGTFIATPVARALTTARVMDEAPVGALLRFSDSTSVPTIAENDPRANPRGIGLRLSPRDDVGMDLVGHSANGFPARTPGEFLAFLEALRQHATRPDVLEQHVAAHDAARRYLATPLATPRSYATERYYMLHTYVLRDGRGGRAVGRLTVEPAAGAAYLTETEAAAERPNFLQREIRERVGRGPVELRLVLAHAEPGDATDDISTPWPDARRRTLLGTVRLDQVSPDQGEQDRLVFDPARTAPGIEAAGDAMLAARHSSYPIAFARRQSRIGG